MKNYVKKNGACLAGALVCVLISTVLAVALQFFKGSVLDSAAAGNGKAAFFYALALVIFILGESVFFFFYRRLSDRFSIGCVTALKGELFGRILNLGYVEYQRQPQGAYIARLTNEANTIQARYFDMLPQLFEILLKVVGVSAALFLLDWKIALVTIALLTMPLYVPKLMEGRLQRAQAQSMQAVQENLEKITDYLKGFEIVKNFSIERKILARFEKSNEEVRQKQMTDANLGAAAQLMTMLMSYLSYFVVLACAAVLVVRGDFTAGDFFVAIGMIDQLSYPMIALAGILRCLTAVRPANEAMRRFMEEGQSLSDGECVRRLQTSIRFRDVCFAYEEKRPLLMHFNLTVKKGGRCLIKGPSGCGKTTAINLLLRYRQVNGGAIEIDGRPIETLGSMYGLITVVRQEAVLFHDTLRNNLTLYRELPDGALVAMLRRMGLEKLANAQTLDALVTEQGANFSGGEKKRICLARALLRETDVLILDEPLANLDEETARRIEDVILSIRDRTVLMVSHQFSEEKLGQFETVYEFRA